MCKVAICAAAAVALTSSVSFAAEGLERSFTIPGTDHVIVVGTVQAVPPSRPPDKALTAALATWVSSALDLAAPTDLPRIEFASPKMMMLRRHQDIRSHMWQGSEEGDLVAVYDDENRLVLLPEDWTGSTPQEISVLVHEMVHHVQNAAGQRFACPEEREKAAFALQDRWLAMFGGSLHRDFGIDGLSLLVKSTCSP